LRAYEFITETASTGQGGGSAGSNGGQMVGGPTTYEEEYNMFKRKGPRRITAMTTESEKSFPNVVDNIVKNIPNVDEIYFHGSRAIGKGKRKSDWDILVIVDNSVVGNEYIDTVFALQKIAKHFKNFDIQPSHENSNIARIAKEEGKLLYSANQKIDEALDSSYEYTNKEPGRYYFETEDGVKYKVYFQGDDLVEVAFSAVLPGEEENFRPDKTTLTGTGNSRKVFGTVVNIVKDFIQTRKPNTLYFTGSGSEPSRIRLYDTMLRQVEKALPDYYSTGAIDLGNDKAYMIKRKSKQVNEDANKTITLADIYDGAYPDDDEVIWNYVGDSDFDIPFTVQTIQPMILDQILTMQYGVEHIEDLYDIMQPEQIEIIDHYKNDPNLSHQVIVMNQDRIIDGNHRAAAAVLANKPIKYIDISEDV
jgi:predicted nucleotidyltransferase